MAEELINKSLKYMDWNPYLHSVNDDLNVINGLIGKAYELGKGNVKQLAINLQALYYSRQTYIRKPKILITINKIISQFHNPSFMRDYRDGKANANDYEYKCINILLECYSEMVKSLSENKIIPEVDITKMEQIDDDYLGGAI